jgi:lysozyme
MDGYSVKMSAAGLQMLKKLEGCKTVPYKDVAGHLTVGVGHLLTEEEIETGLIHDEVPFAPGAPITMEQCLQVLALDVGKAEAEVHLMVEVWLEQYEFDALVSFVYNIGAGAFASSTLLKKLNSGDHEAVPNEMRRWNKVGGKVVTGLENRREYEVKMWQGYFK